MKAWGTPAVVAGLSAGGLLVVSGMLALSQSATAEVRIDNGAPGMLSIEASALPEWSRQMQPGDSVLWPISLHLDVEAPGELVVQIEHSGELAEHPAGLHLDLQRCELPWEGAECAAGPTTVLAEAVAAIQDLAVTELGAIEPGGGPYFMATLFLPEEMPVELQGTAATIALGFTAAGDTATVTTPGPLPNTGSTLAPAVAVAAVIVVVGLVLARQRASTGARR